MEKATDEMISIDQSIVDPMKMIKSGINLDNSPNVDQSSKMEIVTNTPVMKQIENTPLLQVISQSQNIITDSTKSSNKKKKSNKHLVQQVITALDNQYIWEQVNLSWNRHVPLKQPTRLQGNNTNKNQRISGSQQTQKKQQNSSKNSKKKLQETKSDKKSKKDKKDKSRKASRSKILAKIIDVLRKLI
ncbi:unnamed protein product [Rhizophagus irregularis]|uniref:Uncharacterized protein n=1 Tax=Rhizophagus irregularis TaxID=588596 RepID=A0A915ZQ18_9GLOM|nr:unnamed protein product [Rhizophagus irregularis]CAB5382844.1 unnamed protein product [Rhizophagus irregularis]